MFNNEQARLFERFRKRETYFMTICTQKYVQRNN